MLEIIAGDLKQNSNFNLFYINNSKNILAM